MILGGILILGARGVTVVKTGVALLVDLIDVGLVLVILELGPECFQGAVEVVRVGALHPNTSMVSARVVHIVQAVLRLDVEVVVVVDVGVGRHTLFLATPRGGGYNKRRSREEEGVVGSGEVLSLSSPTTEERESLSLPRLLGGPI